MKRLLILAVICLFLSSMAMGQGMPKKAGTTSAISTYSPKTETIEPTGGIIDIYEPAVSLLLACSFDGHNIGNAIKNVSGQIGAAYPFGPKSYGMAMVEIGQDGEENKEIFVPVEGLYFFTSGKSAFNLGVTGGVGPLFEQISSGAATPDEWVTYLLTVTGVVGTYSFSNDLGGWMKVVSKNGEDYRTVSATVGVSILF